MTETMLIKIWVCVFMWVCFSVWEFDIHMITSPILYRKNDLNRYSTKILEYYSYSSVMWYFLTSIAIGKHITVNELPFCRVSTSTTCLATWHAQQYAHSYPVVSPICSYHVVSPICSYLVVSAICSYLVVVYNCTNHRLHHLNMCSILLRQVHQ